MRCGEDYGDRHYPFYFVDPKDSFPGAAAGRRAVQRAQRQALLSCSSFLPSPLPVHLRRRPIGGVAGEPVFSCFAVVIDVGGSLNKCGSIIEPVDVDQCADTGGGLANRADRDSAAATNQEFGSARTESVGFDKRPVLGPISTDPRRSLVVRVLWAR
jgi:hypothetical protein